MGFLISCGSAQSCGRYRKRIEITKIENVKSNKYGADQTVSPKIKLFKKYGFFKKCGISNIRLKKRLTIQKKSCIIMFA